MAERSILGIIERIKDSSTGPSPYRLAILRPLHTLSPDRLDWREIVNLTGEFPDRGRVTWFSPPNEQTEKLEGSLWEFAVKESHTYGKGDYSPDEFCIDLSVAPQPQRPREVIDLSISGKPFVPEDVRRRIAEEGLQLDFNPPLHVYLLVDEGTLVGPIKFVRKDSRWFADPQFLEANLIDVHPFSKRKIKRLVLDEVIRHLIPPGVIIENKQTSLEWAPDDVVIKRILKWIGDQSLAIDSIGLTKAGITRAGTLIANGHANQQRQQQYDRAVALLNNLERNHLLALDVQQVILKLPAVVNQINDKVEDERRKASDRIESELSDEITRTTALRVQKAALEEEIRQIESRLEEQRKALEFVSDTAKETLEEALTLKLQELSDRPEQTLADIMIFRAALGTPLSPPTLQPPISAPSVPKLSLPTWRDSANLIRNKEEFWGCLKDKFTNRGLSNNLARQLYSVLCAGLMPVLAGSDSYDVLKLFSFCATGGRVLWIPVSPAIIEPSDLLGKVNSHSGRFDPHPNRLVDLLIHAAVTDDLFIVVLDGINRASVDSYLNPLLALYEDIQSGTAQPRSLSLLHPRDADPGDPYSLAINLTWRPNVLLAGIWADGVIGSLTPPSFWKQVIFIPTDQRNTDGKLLAAKKSPVEECSAVSFDLWKSWRQTEESAKENPLEKIKNLTARLDGENITLGRKLLSNYSAVSQAIVGCGASAEEASDEAKKLCFVPWLVAEGREQLLGEGDPIFIQLVKQHLS